MPYRVFVINTGSTSTKCALFEDENCLVKGSITTDPELVRNALKSIEQLPQSYAKYEGKIRPAVTAGCGLCRAYALFGAPKGSGQKPGLLVARR